MYPSGSEKFTTQLDTADESVPVSVSTSCIAPTVVLSASCSGVCVCV